MKQNFKNIHDFDDLLFESRNKDYGAYQLRKKYNSVVSASIFLASLLVFIVVILPFVFTPHSDNVLNGSRSYTLVQMENLEPPKEEIYVPPSPPPPQAVHVEEIVKYVPPMVLDSVPAQYKSQLTSEEYLNQTTNEKIGVTGTGSDDNLMTGQDGPLTDESFFIVEVMPSFRGGGLDKFSEWVKKKINYPKEAIDNKIKGKVLVTFIVEKDGSVSNVAIVKGVHPLLDNEAVKVISESPKWTPGLQRGQPVRIRYLIPLVFTPS